MRKLSLVLALLSLGLVFTTSQALAFSLAGGYLGPVKFKISDWSYGTTYTPVPGGWNPSWDNTGTVVISDSTYGQAATYPGEDAWGIAKITSIEDLVGNQLWSDISAPEQLTIIYYGIDDDYVAASGGGFNVKSVAGFLDVYIQSKADPLYTAFDPTSGPGGRTGIASYPTVTDGSIFLSGMFVPGVQFGDGSILNDHITYNNIFDPSAAFYQALGSFYISLTGGAYQGMFDSDYFTLVSDSGVTSSADLLTSFRGYVPGSYGWLVDSEDPAFGYAVPEPTSMTLLIVGMLGLVTLRRKVA